jgi:AraC-like DNA-binding protein
MLTDAMDASAAVYHVGYASCSQFSREYSRLFGAPPFRDVGLARQQTPRDVCSGGLLIHLQMFLCGPESACRFVSYRYMVGGLAGPTRTIQSKSPSKGGHDPWASSR